MIVHNKLYLPISVSFVCIVELTSLNRNLCFGEDRLLPKLSVNFKKKFRNDVVVHACAVTVARRVLCSKTV